MFVHELWKNADPSRLALDGNRALTYAQLSDQVRVVRNVLYKKGIRRKDRVALYSANGVEFVVVYMAVVSLGAIIIPVNSSLVDREVDFILRDSETKLLVTDTPLQVEAPQISVDALMAEANQDAAEEAPAFPSDITENDVCTFVYTSGTTGSPKGAMLTHKNLVRNAEQTNEVITHTPEDKALCVLPMFHCYGWTVSVLVPLLAGCTIVVMKSKIPTEIIHTITRKQVTVAAMVPPMYHLLARLGRPEAMKTVRIFVSGGASLPQPVAEAFAERYGHNVIIGYGLTEASPVVTMLPPDQPKSLSAGPAIPGVEIKVVSDDGKECKTGEVGELLVRGDNVMKGYWHKDEETKKVLIADGWLRTGDLAYLDKDKFVYIVDRIKDLIIVNGENIYPGEVEDCIYEYEGVSECAVVGHSDSLRGQAVWAYIVMKEGYTLDENEIRKFMKGRIAAYKIPRHFIEIDEMPKNSTGKILKRALRK